MVVHIIEMVFNVVEASSPRHEKVQLKKQPVDEFDSNEPGPVAAPAPDPQVERDFIEEFEVCYCLLVLIVLV